MKPKYELNNIVYDLDGKTIIKVSGDDTYFEAQLYKPIPLTKEWLLKFDLFEKYQSIHNDNFSGNIHIEYNKYINNYTFYIGNFDVVMLEYVHQLQNLYFILSGRKLEIK